MLIQRHDSATKEIHIKIINLTVFKELEENMKRRKTKKNKWGLKDKI